MYNYKFKKILSNYLKTFNLTIYYSFCNKYKFFFNKYLYFFLLIWVNLFYNFFNQIFFLKRINYYFLKNCYYF